MSIKQVLFFILFSFLYIEVDAQAMPPIELEQNLEIVQVDRYFSSKYKRKLRQLRRVYPLALQAKKFMLDFQEDIDSQESKRNKKKISKKAHKGLKEKFNYSIRDLYIEEGVLLMKLIHRETGMTVEQIVSTYRGGFQVALYSTMAIIWDQDIGVKYEPFGEDWITEMVISDIINKRVEFDWEIAPLNRRQFKTSIEEYKENVKKSKQASKARKRRERQKNRQDRRDKKEKNP
jgi:hypothetical protein